MTWAPTPIKRPFKFALELKYFRFGLFIGFPRPVHSLFVSVCFCGCPCVGTPTRCARRRTHTRATTSTPARCGRRAGLGAQTKGMPKSLLGIWGLSRNSGVFVLIEAYF
jgi:hypothetical protein